ncbi:MULTISPECIES: phosphoribosylaminoimidazolesuccinocarboxamide synthase [Mammaliicoccus]|uniref:phosphoribosylaminoimidazolesuccinocarboxamide synthase n=1 Tax=Mammaliicoccus TaxID=2803850 RepID=UPI001AAD3A5E|nr:MULTISPECIES: phosphoribosylaminoimidazolesuccinocarboxamide synthase [Mammaliicoccus]MBO3063032.1 phosphoribosylaminoimidazolesuccinocarboxamide synthase [Mammaliicoccus fleurettii]MEB6202083.1 phosphoribosylaminoimidazolesuccinocarboxamide synthase [Mammaliicoccus fleurettii]MEB7723673.1 phosphoribosylaminoimidazolesuccinocarboxamide synthase [Mammaliicoccus fleurettii]MEB7779131.1 phosphoribosylaminoimidazolesuccinocarboxamide synthase [Mammaliicoccus fleurettii]MEB7805308.1 phosphoribos
MSLLYEGKAKRVFNTEQEGVLRIEYKDEVTAGNGAKKDEMIGKGRLNNLITSKIFGILKQKGVSSHFIEQISDTEQLVKSVDIFPLEVVVRNVAAGSICKRLGFEKGHTFKQPLLELFYKKDELNDPLITDDHVALLNIASTEQLSTIKDEALKVNEVLSKVMNEMNLILVDYKIEFGITKDGQILLADEISPDTCRIWDKETKENFDKDVYREDTGSLIDTYETFYKKLEEL